MGDDEKTVLSVEEVAAYLGIGRTLAFEAVARGDIPHWKIGRRIVVSKRVLDRLLEGNEAADSSSTAGGTARTALEEAAGRRGGHVSR